MRMKRTIVLLLFLSPLSLEGIFQATIAASTQNLEGPFRVQRVIDGDTVVLDDGRHLRYRGINSPERDERFWTEARDYNAHMVNGKWVLLEFENGKEDAYGRILAYVYVTGDMINAHLLTAGLAHLFVLEPMKYYRRFLRLQEEARAKNVGIWSKGGAKGPLKITRLNADAQGDDRYNLNGEYVRICNISSTTIDTKGFTLSDCHGHTYTFPRAILRPGYTALLFTGAGTDLLEGADQLHLYWHSNYPVWNNKGDTASLKDISGQLIDVFVYKKGH